MSSAVAIIDYGVGNLKSVLSAFYACGVRASLVSGPEKVCEADRLILPGVGAFGDCMSALKTGGFVEPLREFIKSGRPTMGICVGMQMLFDVSEEFGEHQGLGLMRGRVVRLEDTDTEGRRHRIPNVGWLSIDPPEGRGEAPWSGILRSTRLGEEMYFVHSYTAAPLDDKNRVADALYGGRRIAAVVQKDNLFGTQFHPEKSGPSGLEIIREFVQVS